MLCWSMAACAQHWKLYTEHFPPYSYAANDGYDGFAVALIDAMMREAGHTYTLSLLPWPRAIRFATEQPNSMVFSTARNQARDNDFHWIGPLHGIEVFAWYSPKAASVEGRPLRQVILRDGGLIERLAEQQLLHERSAVYVTKAEQALGMLVRGRAEQGFMAENMVQRLKREYPEDIATLQRGEQVARLDLFYAVNRDSNPDAIKALEQAFARLQQSGVLNGLLQDFDMVPVHDTVAHP
ncbi:transporter substrate-binding domain-containing protein [Aestuariibacter halophilus]|uniref:Transporter substrate-binding domain-containing protein n=1 Tax=Fluctibacter halophilus TaxID=226011 RepID=A0ABS8G6P5_9ALTE|nr:transporter substrate-binding domain-containing protein [Aestuariibacter halophilus]MCC2616193.1 transporter substrate-binding domain-containing protein [Aestuariibacter halophilus]